MVLTLLTQTGSFSNEKWNRLRDNNALSIVFQLCDSQRGQQNGNNNDGQRNVNVLFKSTTAAEP
jgi:hypothetical protein